MCYIKIDRNITDWEWYTNQNTFRLFVHFLIRANWKPGKFEGVEIKRGSFVSSVRKLCMELDLSEREIRTAIKHLESTGEITKESHRRYTVFTITNYEKYQGVEPVKDNNENRQTNDGQTTDKRRTNDGQETDERPMENLENKGVSENHEKCGMEKGQTQDGEAKTKKDKTQSQKSTIEEVKNKRINKKESPKGDKKKFFENPELNDAFLSYVEMRKNIRAPVKTDRQVKLLMNSLDKFAGDGNGGLDEPKAVRVIDQSTVNCWKNFYELKDGYGRQEGSADSGRNTGESGGCAGSNAGYHAQSITELVIDGIGDGELEGGNAFLGFRHPVVPDVRRGGVDCKKG